MMNSNSTQNASSGTASNEPNIATLIDSRICIMPMPKNPRDYPPFDMRSVLNYMSNQITYYHMAGAIPTTELTNFQQSIKQ